MMQIAPARRALALFLSLGLSACATAQGAGAPRADAPETLSAYLQLLREHPHLLAQPGHAERGEIEIVTDAAEIRRIEAQMEARYLRRFPADVAYTASRAGIVMQDPYVIMLRDAVHFPGGASGLYNRKLSRITLDGGAPGTFCMVLREDGRVVLVREFRHQERAWRISLPGGYREAGETLEEAARREVAEETGLTASHFDSLGTVDHDLEAVPLLLAHARGAAQDVSPDEGEALQGTVAWTLDELDAAIVAGGYRDETGRWYAMQGAISTGAIRLRAWLDAARAGAPAAGVATPRR